MIIEKVTTQNSGVRINWNMFWMQMKNNWLFQMLSVAVGISGNSGGGGNEESQIWRKCFCYLLKEAMQTYHGVYVMFFFSLTVKQSLENGI